VSVPSGVRTVAPVIAEATRLSLVRHGEAACNVSGVVGGPKGCTGLSPTGVAQAEALRRRLADSGAWKDAAALYASILPRALDTAGIVAPTVGDGSLEVVADCGVCELHPGAADGLDWASFAERFSVPDWDSDPGVPLAPGAESWSGFVARASGALAQLAERHAGEHVVVVCHAGVVEAAVLAFLPVGGGRHRMGLRTDHTAITEFERQEGQWRLLRYNDAAHVNG